MKTLRHNQSGMAAIVIAVVLMLVITLISLGFAQIVRRQQRQTLDHQLSSQAYYAAESGVNLAQSVMRSSGVTAKNNCDAGSYDYAVGDTSEITCLLIQDQLTSQDYTSVAIQPIVAHVQRADGTGISTVSISWQSHDNPTAAASCMNTNSLPDSSTTWSCGQPLLRVDLVPTGGSLTQTGLQNAQRTAFLYPVGNGGAPTTVASGDISGASLGSKMAIRCTNTTDPNTHPYACTAQITGLTASASYAVRVMSFYGASDVRVFSIQGASPAPLVGGQVLIDSTGKSVDVLRRVQVRVSPETNTPAFGFVSGAGACKLYVIQPTSIEDQCNGSVLGDTDTTPPVDNGAFERGNGGGGGGGGNGPGPFWQRSFTITVVPTTRPVTGCTWDWGDRSARENLSPGRCQVGQTIQHTFPKILTCTQYTVSLVFHTSGGDVAAPKRIIKEPHGTGVCT